MPVKNPCLQPRPPLRFLFPEVYSPSAYRQAQIHLLGYITLEWNQPNACLDPDGYDVYRDNVKINTELVTDLTYVDGPLTSGLYEYKLKAVYYFGVSGFSTPAYALIPVGIEETGDDTFRIYPNPASQIINIESGLK